MKTAIVILNWNTKEFLGKFLPGLLASVKSVDGAEVIVADNASTDGSAQFMKENFPDVRTIVFNENLGFTGGYNKAFEEIVTKAGAEAPEYFLLINSDIEVTDGWLEPLVEWMDNNPCCGACAPSCAAGIRGISLNMQERPGGILTVSAIHSAEDECLEK